MDNHFFKIFDSQSFEELLKRSNERPVVILKHSTTCPISAAAYREMSSGTNEVGLIEVQSARELSNEVERRTGVSHETPQVLVFRNGKVVWNASHWHITADAVADAVRENE